MLIIAAIETALAPAEPKIFPIMVAATRGVVATSDAVIGYWTRFAATGDPNGAGAVIWPQFDALTDPFLRLGPTNSSGTGLHSDNCDYWESVLY